MTLPEPSNSISGLSDAKEVMRMDGSPGEDRHAELKIGRLDDHVG